MDCSYCGSRAVYHARHFGKSFCRRHLENYLLRKLRRNLSRYELVSPGDKIALAGDGSPAGAAAAGLFRQAVERWPVELVEGGHDKKVVPRTLECEANAIVSALARGEVHASGYARGSEIFPFRDFPAKALFTLGWLQGHKKEGVKGGPLEGFQQTASNLNLLRAWDRITGLL
jgi:hypothetical protein